MGLENRQNPDGTLERVFLIEPPIMFGQGRYRLTEVPEPGPRSRLFLVGYQRFNGQTWTNQGCLRHDVDKGVFIDRPDSAEDRPREDRERLRMELNGHATVIRDILKTFDTAPS